jgi:hypothetical protein
MRIKRGTLSADKEGGRLFVLLDAEPTADPTDDQMGAMITSLQDQVQYLREQLEAEREARTEERRWHDTFMAQLMQRIPEIEAPREPRESPVSPGPREPSDALWRALESQRRPQRWKRWISRRNAARPCRLGLLGGGGCSVADREARPRDDRDAAQDIARDLADLAGQLASLKDKAYNWLSAPDYATPRPRLEDAHEAVEAAAVEARRRVRLNEGRER